MESQRPHEEQVIADNNPKSIRNLVFAVATAQFLTPFMFSGISPILPQLGEAYDASALALSLVMVTYSLALSIMHLLAGRIGDIFGRKRVFLTGLSLFTSILVIAPFSPTIEIFVVLRFFQALGAAMMNTSALAILVASVPTSIRGRVLGLSATGTYLGMSLGPTASSFLTSLLSWKGVFFALIPFCLLAWWATFSSVKTEWRDAPEDGFDWLGTLFYVFGITAFSLGSIWILEGVWAIVLCLLGLLLLISFVIAERKVNHPVLDVDFLVHNRNFMIGVLAAFVNYISVVGTFFYFSLYLQEIKGFSVFHAGLMMSVQPCAQFLMSAKSGQLGDRLGAGIVSTFGLALSGICLWLCGTFDPDSNIYVIGITLAFLGLGSSLFVVPNTSEIMGSVDTAHLGQASGLVGTMRTLGVLVCMMIISLTMNMYLGNEALSNENASSFLTAMKLDFRIFSVFNLLAFVISAQRLLPLLQKWRKSSENRPS